MKIVQSGNKFRKKTWWDSVREWIFIIPTLLIIGFFVIVKLLFG